MVLHGIKDPRSFDPVALPWVAPISKVISWPKMAAQNPATTSHSSHMHAKQVLSLQYVFNASPL